MSEKQKMIELRGTSTAHRITATNFLNEVIKLAKEGYVLHPKPTSLRKMARFQGRPFAVFVTEEYAKEIMEDEIAEVVEEKVVTSQDDQTIIPQEDANSEEQPSATPESSEDSSEEEVTQEDTLKDEVRAISGKDDLISFAKEKGLEVPDNVKHPKAIQKWIIEELTK